MVFYGSSCGLLLNSGAYHLYVDFVDLGIQHSLTNNNKMGDNSQHQHPTMMFHIPPFK